MLYVLAPLTAAHVRVAVVVLGVAVRLVGMLQGNCMPSEVLMVVKPAPLVVCMFT